MQPVIMGDLYRSRTIVEANTDRLWNILREPLAAVGPYAVRWHKSLPGPWETRFAGKPSSALLDRLRPFRGRSLVLCFETPPVMESAFRILGIDFIDIGIHPVRFGNDLMLSMRASRADMAERIAKYAPNLGAFVKGYNGRPIQAPELRGAPVFFAQCEKDRTLISEGRFCTWQRARRAILEHVAGRPWFVKPHPFGPDNTYVRGAVRAGAKLLTHNTYDLLASGIPFEPFGLSSSVLTEAKLFGYAPCALLAIPPVGTPILHDFRRSSFWAVILGTPGMTRLVSPDFEDNFLRKAFGVTWDYQSENF
jgi:hypothetical protein